MAQLIDYSVRLAPGLAVIVVAVALLGRHAPALRIGLLISAFVLMRDLMTPMGFWQFGRTDAGLPWLRFLDDGFVISALAGAALALTAVAVLTQRDLAAGIVWGRLDVRALLTALGAAAVILVPLLLLMDTVPLADRGGPVAVAVIWPLLLIAYGGNLMEEVLFRGMLQGHLDSLGIAPRRVVLLSGLFFAAGHVFLAATVTSLGWPLLLFALVEGLACAWVRQRAGVLASTVTHGSVIFVLAVGI
ncbi:CPBP family intramembrane glutamic endopeptidase [Pseudonocardia sp. TRM90224]|uniref:CPBP family intramembrane glutamic endopeptidase n=1 Tax=Pseudonocardia sp. TRM90224 TaxID=2812678 RepID=UPI001E333939|nr:CPBP family intramembrane glutamic endopeptidase [Pseudonocardia sp. TRM90224]